MREIVEQSAEIYALKTDAKGIELTTHIGAERTGAGQGRSVPFAANYPESHW